MDESFERRKRSIGECKGGTKKMVNAHRRPAEHFRKMKSGKVVKVNKGIKYTDYVSKRMKGPDIQKLPFLKRMGAIAKDWKELKKVE